MLVGAGVVGAAVGAGSIATTSEGRAALIVTAKHVADAAVGKRKREPREGDYWSRCDDARAAGTAPIYRGEPGYRRGLDRDNDGIACEPYRRR
ncbi:excalibur calcium-binding domain-containing protein [Sphingopyxis indica]|uniref:excalibur calcium-binding domain-containing protein n=1 Tax=Sphingopyxis indica TaxID=436663 RepID=UPI001FE946BB|nr:excalibur calcium-binding domain-containing protein [Sphingopyxis indica]